MRYSQAYRLSARGVVNEVPDNTSAYRPIGACCGELRPMGKAPASASLHKALPKPVR
jgi:hypothetical protein